MVVALAVSVVIVVSKPSIGKYGFFQQPEVERKKVKRVKRPEFTERDSKGIYFGSVFDEAIQGDRPTVVAGPVNNPKDPLVGSQGSSNSTDGFAWSDYISGDVIETEIKRLQKLVAQQVTSPGKYKTEYQQARYSFQMLSMLFAIIVEHDEDVRWKRVANLAQPSFAKAAKNARRGDADSYNYAVARRDDLAELIRGGNMTSNEKVAEAIVWGDTVGRSPLMKRLQDTMDRVKPWLSTRDEFTANQEEILHEASLLAAMSEVLAKETMEDAEEEDYVAHAVNMSAAARLMMSNTLSNNYDLVSEGFNQASQACSDCHDEWR